MPFSFTSRTMVLTAVLVTLTGVNALMTAQVSSTNSNWLQIMKQKQGQQGQWPTMNTQKMKPSAPASEGANKPATQMTTGGIETRCPDTAKLEVAILRYMAELHAMMARLEKQLSQTNSSTTTDSTNQAQ